MLKHVLFALALLLAGVAQAGDVSELQRLHQEGIQAYKYKDYPTALDKLEQGLELARQLKSKKSISSFSGNIGAVYYLIGKYEKSLEYSEIALSIDRETGDKYGEYSALINIGNIYRRFSQYGKALDYYEKALSIITEINNSGDMPIVLSNIGLIHHMLGQYNLALEYYEKARRIDHERGDRSGEGAGIVNIALIYKDIGQYEKALEYYEQALLIDRESDDRDGEGTNLINLGTVYQQLDQEQKAKEYYEQALVIFRKIKDKKFEALALFNLGTVYWNLKQYSKSLELHKKALIIRRDIGDRHGERDSLMILGQIYQYHRQPAKAQEYYNNSLSISRELGDLIGEGSGLFNIGLLNYSQKNYYKAKNFFREALSTNIQSGEPENLWRAWKGLYDVTEKLNNPNAAIFYGKQAVNTLQKLRANVAQLNDKSLNESFMADKKDVYQGLADLLLRQGRLFEAQKVLELLKQEEYFDFIRRTRAYEIPDDGLRYTPPEQTWAARFQEISAQLVTLGEAYSLLRARKARGETLNAQEARRLEELRENMATADRALQAWFKDTDTALASLKQEDLQKVLDEFFAGDQNQLRGVLQRLGQGTVLLHFVPMPDSLHILVTTPALTVRREVAVKREDIAKAVLALREALKQEGRQRGWGAEALASTSSASASALPFPEPVEGSGADLNELKKPAQQLHDWLIKPIAEDLRRADAQVLMVYLFGEMRYLPLAALHDGEHWLAENYALAIYAAAADKGLEIQPRRAEWKVAGLGVSEAHEGFAPLPAVKAELDGIVRRGADDRSGALPGEIHLDAAFTENRLRDVLDRDFPVLHIASHFNLNIGKDTDSFLLLGDGGHLSLADIGEKRFEWGGLDLLALSACNTGMGLGHADADGTEVEGMGVTVMKQGARSVLATLWQVSDQSTADFMQRLYAGQAAGPLSKAKAIQQIQRAFIQADKSGLPGYYAHPFHWAPFILMGNWL